jgi:hypothetical protein
MSQSTFITIDTTDELSVQYNNLYVINGIIYYFSIGVVTLPIVNIWTDSYGWHPLIKIFNDEIELDNFVRNNLSNAIQIDNAIYGGIIWSHNIGHGLLDGLYPSYLSLVKFGKWNDTFTFITNDWDDASQINMTQGVVESFSRSSILELNKSKSNTYIINTLISGTGRTGIRVMREDYTLYGKKYDGIKYFRKRILETYNLNPDKEVNRNNPNIIFINNIRYSTEERIEIDKVIEYYKDLGYNIEFLLWENYKTFGEQMKRFEDVDIQVSGPGTGMNYSPLLKRGAVSINLGCINYIEYDTNKPFVCYMEQAVGAGQDQISTLFYDRSNYYTLLFDQMILIINKAISLTKESIVLEDNHNTDAKVFIEYCKRVPNAREVSNYLTRIANFIECFVNDLPNATPEHLVNIPLLNEIKKELNFKKLF